MFNEDKPDFETFLKFLKEADIDVEKAANDAVQHCKEQTYDGIDVLITMRANMQFVLFDAFTQVQNSEWNDMEKVGFFMDILDAMEKTTNIIEKLKIEELKEKGA